MIYGRVWYLSFLSKYFVTLAIISSNMFHFQVWFTRTYKMHVKDVVQNMNENLIRHNICVRYKHEETRFWKFFVFFENILVDIFMRPKWCKVFIPWFLKFSKVSLQTVSRIFLYHSWNRGIRTLTYQKNCFYLLQWKHFKNDEKYFLFHVISCFRS